MLDQSWFEGVVFLYESGFRFPTVLRGGYELGERMLHKDERSWGQILDQTLEQLVADRAVQRADPVRVRLHLPL